MIRFRSVWMRLTSDSVQYYNQQNKLQEIHVTISHAARRREVYIAIARYQHQLINKQPNTPLTASSSHYRLFTRAYRLRSEYVPLKNFNTLCENAHSQTTRVYFVFDNFLEILMWNYCVSSLEMGNITVNKSFLPWFTFEVCWHEQNDCQLPSMKQNATSLRTRLYQVSASTESRCDDTCG